MTDTNDSNGRRRPARALTEQALEAERAGDQERADDLFAEAERIDPDETVEVLEEQTDPRKPERGDVNQ